MLPCTNNSKTCLPGAIVTLPIGSVVSQPTGLRDSETEAQEAQSPAWNTSGPQRPKNPNRWANRESLTKNIQKIKNNCRKTGRVNWNDLTAVGRMGENTHCAVSGRLRSSAGVGNVRPAGCERPWKSLGLALPRSPQGEAAPAIPLGVS